MITFTKRQKIVLATLVLTVGLLLIQSISFFVLRYRLIIFLSLLALGLSLWALWEGITKLKAAVLLILPTLFTLGVASFYFLLPFRWLTRLPVTMIFAVSFYSLLLAQNVFNVAAERTIPLYRAAFTVAFLFTLITSFFIFNAVFALNLPFYWNGVVVVLVSFPLILQLLWSIDMGSVNSLLIVYSVVLSLIVGEFSLAFSFWPLVPTMYSLSLSTAIYVLMGVVSSHLRERISKRLIWEYVGIGGAVLLFTILITTWT